MQTSKNSLPFRIGQDAYKKGRELTENPYPLRELHKRIEWSKGWLHEMKKKEMDFVTEFVNA